MKIWAYGDDINTDMGERLAASLGPAINQGLLLIECMDAVVAYKPGLPVELLLKESSLKVGDQTFKFPKLPPEILAIRDAGGLLQFTRARLRAKKDTK